MPKPSPPKIRPKAQLRVEGRFARQVLEAPTGWWYRGHSLPLYGCEIAGFQSENHLALRAGRVRRAWTAIGVQRAPGSRKMGWSA